MSHKIFLLLLEMSLMDSLSHATKQAFYLIADKKTQPGAMAQNILQHIDTAFYPEVYILPGLNPQQRNYDATDPNLLDRPQATERIKVFNSGIHTIRVLIDGKELKSIKMNVLK